MVAELRVHEGMSGESHGVGVVEVDVGFKQCHDPAVNGVGLLVGRFLHTRLV